MAFREVAIWLVMTVRDPVTSRYLIRFATPSDREAIQRFNKRLAAGGATYRMPLDGRLDGEKHSAPDYFLFRKQMLVTEGQEVRGGVLLQHHRVAIWGVEQPFCWLQLPVSEGLVNNAYATAVIPLLNNMLRHERIVMGLGVGSYQEKWSQILVRTRWRHQKVPFLFYPRHLKKVLTEVRHLNSKPLLKLAGRAASYSGLGSLVGFTTSIARKLKLDRSDWVARVEPGFDTWADEVYDRAKSRYGALANRQSASLNILYPPDDWRYIRIRVQSKSTNKEIGWILTVHKQMRDDQHFGNLHVGTLVNGLAELQDVSRIITAGFDHLADVGVDVIVCNWSHSAWVQASRSQYFLSGPSNFIYFVSPQATPILEEQCPLGECHMTRGDGDIPSSLMPRRK
jgi:hypothetical protein